MKQNMRNGIRLTVLAGAVLLGGMVAAGNAEAANCELLTGQQPNGSYLLDPSLVPINITFPFSVARLTGSAEPVGSTLYSGMLINTLGVGISCDSPVAEGGHQVFISYESTPLGLWMGDIGQYSGKIYNTGVEGIGFVVRPMDPGVFGSYDGDAAPVTGIRFWGGQGGEASGASGHILPALDYVFIKTGPINYGTIDGALLPTVVVDIKAGNLDLRLFRMNFSGTITINKPTCHSTETNKVVALGTWHLRDFANVGDVSSWVDSGLTMVCDDAFWGGSGGTYDVQFEMADSLNIIRKTYSTPSSDNTWAVRFSSSTGLIDATQGIIALDSSNGDNATGVGIQLSSSADAAGIMDLTTGWGGTIDLGSSTFHIPIFARYIRTGDITAGSANGKVIYTVDYQ